MHDHDPEHLDAWRLAARHGPRAQAAVPVAVLSDGDAYADTFGRRLGRMVTALYRLPRDVGPASTAAAPRAPNAERQVSQRSRW